MSSNIQKLMENVAAEADATRDEPMPAGATPSRPDKSVPVAVRLAPDDVAAIEILANKLDVPMSRLLRGWILDALAARRDESIVTALDRVTADIQRLRELVASRGNACAESDGQLRGRVIEGRLFSASPARAGVGRAVRRISPACMPFPCCSISAISRSSSSPRRYIRNGVEMA